MAQQKATGDNSLLRPKVHIMELTNLEKEHELELVRK
jgi:hypothetical protein